ncbi:MAG: hypothetical protein AB1449_01165 [Chloroflexota bacterium]
MNSVEQPASERVAGRWRPGLLRRSRLAEVLWPYLLLAATLWVVRYWHSAQFGLYEDDYTRIPAAMQMPAAELVRLIAENFTRYFYLGRPFHESLIYLFGFWAGKLGGLRVLYGLGYGMLLLNAILFYHLLRRLAGREFAAVGALAFCLYPANTTQTYLTQSFGIQPSLTFFLVACLLYVSGKKTLSYVPIAASLLTYETTFAMFLAAPLLTEDGWIKRKWRGLLVHAAVLGLMLAVVAAIRYWTGEKQVSGLDFPGVVVVPLAHLLVGPLVSLGLFVYRPEEVLTAIAAPVVERVAAAVPLVGWVLTVSRMEGALAADPTLRVELIVSFTLSFPLVYWLLSRLRIGNLSDSSRVWATAEGQETGADGTTNARQLGRLAVAGLTMLALSYPLAYIIPAYTLRGRNTRVHFAGVVGASILIACLWGYLRLRASGRARVRAANSVLAMLLAFLVAHGFLVQGDYALSWRLQRQFWTQVARLCPDVADGTVVLVEPNGLRDTWQIAANTWNLPRILNQVYQFPANWGEVPRVYRLEPGWEEYLVDEDGAFSLDANSVTAPRSLYRQVQPSNVIFLASTGSGLVRRYDPLIVGGVEFAIRGAPPLASDLEPGVLYPLLVGGD